MSAGDSLDAFTRAYIECALWSSTDNADESGGEPLDANYDMDDLAPEALASMVQDCAAFRESSAHCLSRAGDDEQNGHDFWLTRNRHGAGFWDRGYPADVAGALTDSCHAWGSVDLYVGDDGKVHAQ